MSIHRTLHKSIVRLTNTTHDESRSSMGSGVLFTPSGLVLTNNHVIEDSDFGTAFGKIAVQLLERVDQPPLHSVAAEIVIRNEVYDLAVLRLEGVDQNPFIDILAAPPLDESLIERRIRVFGYPPVGGETITITRGIVSGFDGSDVLKTDAEINPGNSGGAAFDDLDTYLGIPTFIVGDAHGKLGFIISTDRIRNWLKTILRNGLPIHAEELSTAFEASNLLFAGDNVDQSNQHPRMLGKFAAVERLLSEGRYEECIPHIDFILEKRPRSALAYHYLGNALLGTGRYIEASEQFRTALAYNPNHIPALGNYGVTLCNLNRHGEALQLFEQIIDWSDNPVELQLAYGNIGRIYEIWNQPSVAALYRCRADELSEEAAKRLSEFRRPNDPADKIAAFTNAIVNAEIDLA